MSDQQQAKVKGVVDLVFLVDATASMGPVLDALQRSLQGFIDRVTNDPGQGTLPIHNWRAKAVGFRDHRNDPTTWLEDRPFTRDVATLREQVASLRPVHGGDWPESVLDAIHAMASMPVSAAGTEDPAAWRDPMEAARVVLCFTDTNAHATMSYPGGAGGTIEDVKNALVSNRVRLVLFAPDEQEYHALSAARGVVLEPTDDLGGLAGNAGAFDEAMKALVKTVTVMAAPPAL